ncbi:hypothetical protein PR048_020340 [Dryococelus australis]|uniref:HTH psq-type domain-containing protein n=1 Tax=Dryococelus australis TaxID=614101 RepID=A0ABQ9H651_9NEOP|nr:hypothetical protein PR048_020340 [Dryococelus australis]
MEAVLAAVRECWETILNASKSYDVTYGTLHRHLKKRTAVKSLGWYQPVLTKVQDEPTSVANARGFNKPQANRFYNLYSDIVEKHKINATTLSNVNETVIATTTNRPPKILSSTGKKQTFFEQEINTFQKAHPGRIVNQLDLVRLVTPAFLKSASAKNAVHGFSSTGLWPLHRNIFREEDFAPVTVTDCPPPLDMPLSNQDRVASPPDTLKQFFEDQEACF